jgi:type III pantothenate kinase
MLLADIGNSRVHLFDGAGVTHLSFEAFIKSYAGKKLSYICVNSSVSKQIKSNKLWQDLSSSLALENSYETMGTDRKALCLSHDNGIFVDAGSAITVDIVRNGIYQGGFILLGINAQMRAYKSISTALDIEFNRECSLDFLPLTTKDSVSYGIISSIKSAIDNYSSDLPLYFTGGDGEWLSGFFPQSNFDELLVFRGLQKALKGNI